MVRVILFISFYIVTALFSMLYGQSEERENIQISGSVEDETGFPVAFAIVSLMNADDKQLVKTEASDDNGIYVFEEIPKGKYYLEVSGSDQNIQTGELFEALENKELPSFVLVSQAQKLNEVVVTNSRPFIESKNGVMTMNVENNLASTGSSAFEILEKAPGVNVDTNDNISLRGKNGILIQIDGKVTQMSGTNLANYLRGIPSSNIEKIEFITNPGAKYDAAGSAIINIKLKKDKRKGTNGSLTTAYGQGVYPKSNSSVSVNHRNKKVNVFGTYSFAYREWFNKLLLNRRFYENGDFTGAYDQDNFLKMNFRNHIGRAGADFYLDDKHTIGITGNVITNKFNPTGQNYSDVYDSSNSLSSRFETKNNSRDHWFNYSANLNHKFVIDTIGTELITDMDFANFGNDTKQNFATRYRDLNGHEFQAPYLLHGDVTGDLKIYSLKSDFTTNFNDIKFEAGIKSSYVKADNNLEFYDVSSDEPVFDTTKSNHFIYEENINAAYINGSKQFGKWSVYMGLRVENTNITGKQLVDNTSFDNSYTQLFPSGNISYAFNDNNSLELNYSRRIDRPSYDQLNPFKFFLDPTTYKEGNPYLKAQTTHSLELTYAMNQKMFATLSFARTTDNITEVIAPSDEDQKITVQTNKNLNTADIFGLFLIIPLNVTSWWNTNNSLNFYYGYYSGTIANTTLKNEGNFNYNFNSVNTFKFGNGCSAEVSGNYRAREIYAFMDVDPVWSINLGFQKKFRNSTLKLAFNDIFFTNGAVADTEFTDYKEHFKVQRDTRTFVLSYTYNFGDGNTSQRRRTGGADDLKQRAGGIGG